MNLLALLMTLLASLAAGPALAGDLEGFWKIGDRPVWVEIHPDGDSPSGTVRRNDLNPGAVGLTLLKDISAVSDAPRNWEGRLFAVPVTVTTQEQP